LLLGDGAQNDLGSVYIRFYGTDRTVHYELYANGGGQVEHNVAAVHQLGDEGGIENCIYGVRESSGALHVSDIRERARRKVIDYGNGPAFCQAAFRQM
jgi:hypothetical protein